MDSKQLECFVNTYSNYYFEIDDEKKSYGKEILGVSILHPTSHNYEDDIMTYRSNGKQDIKTIAWKMGVGVLEEGLKTQYYEYPKENLICFIEETNALSLSFDEEGEIRNSYDKVLSIVNENDLVGFGSVYIISSLFFLSKGKVPIYDYYANVGAKALLYDLNPQEIFVASPPTKDEHARGDKTKKSAVNMLMEYRLLLMKLADGTNYFNCEEGYIARDLDRALWVYGHATKKWQVGLGEA